LIVESIRARGFGPYRDEFRLELGAKSYGIVARLRDDPERSNWLGKTTLLGLIYWVLTGDHRERHDDDIVSRGEPLAEGELVLTGGWRLLRTKPRGKAGRLYCHPPKGPASMQAEAQKQADALLGMSKEDFKNTCYFEQKQMARFVLADPADRMKMLSAWFRLGPLQRCEERISARRGELEEIARKIDGHLAGLDQREGDLAAQLGCKEPSRLRTALASARALAQEKLEAHRGRAGAIEDRLQASAAASVERQAIAEYSEVIAEGKKAADAFGKVRLPLLKERAEQARAQAARAGSELDMAARELRERQKLARGEFDGHCPIGRMPCPAKEQINASMTKNEAMLRDADDAWQEAQRGFSAASKEDKLARDAEHEGVALEARLEGLRRRARDLKPRAERAKAAGDPPDPVALRAELDAERAAMLDAKGLVERLKAYEGELDAAAKTRETLLAKRAEMDGGLGLLREAAVVFGKRGAQRRVAEGALAEIESSANDALAGCGASLKVSVAWSREGKGLATACEGCGHPFPASAKAKACARCGAARGPKLENKLDVSLSNVSGAAEDLAGAAIQLAASRWLRSERGTRWSSAMLDEPFGALDAAHRRGFSAHLTAMLAGIYGFEQSFVVAHHAQVLDALPGRIEIVSDGTWSVPRVVA
jgi:DNA repair exonuclease SbcCD ATPase subunit